MFEFLNEYFPEHEENRMKNEGNVNLARSSFVNKKPSNLDFLLRKRYSWMNPFLKGKDNIYELGSGTGFSSFYLNKEVILTDIEKREWIDEVQDALNLTMPDSSVDVFICSHMIHHLAHPIKFFLGAKEKLKPNGLILIQDINTSLVMKILLYIMRHEGYSDKIDPFDINLVANQIDDPWSANCSIPKLLFTNERRFEKLTNLRIVLNKLNEFMIFPLSGGVTAKSKTIIFPYQFLKLIDAIDGILIRLFPSIFALGRSIVLEKNEEE